jgi:hypothetical protein
MPPKRDACDALAGGGGGGKKKKMSTQRSPQDPFQRADNSKEYILEAIVGRCTKKGSTQYLCKWQGFKEKDNTWEPILHLVGHEPAISKFNQEYEEEYIRNSDKEAQKKEEKKKTAEVAAKEKQAELYQSKNSGGTQEPESNGIDNVSKKPKVSLPSLSDSRIRRSSCY